MENCGSCEIVKVQDPLAQGVGLAKEPRLGGLAKRRSMYSPLVSGHLIGFFSLTVPDARATRG